MGADLWRAAGLTLAYFRAHLRKTLEYRAHAALGVAAILSRHVISLLTLWVLFQHTSGLGGWQPFEVLFLYGYVSLITATWHLLFANTIRVEFLVRDAGFDRFLVRPLPPLFQTLFYYFDDDALGDFIPAVACLVVATVQLNLHFTWQVAFVLGLGLVGGVFVHFGIHLLLCSWSFWFVKSRALINLFSDVRRFSEFPLGVFPLPVQWILTVLVPIGFAGFYPVEGAVAIGAASALAWLALPVGLLVLTMGLIVWHMGLARYQSAGS